MKNLILTLIAINFCLTGFSQERIQKKRKLNDYLTEEYEVLKSNRKVKDGRWCLYQSGGLIATGAYRNNERVGRWLFYKKPTELEQVFDYSSGKLSFHRPEESWTYDVAAAEGDTLLRPALLGGTTVGLRSFYKLVLANVPRVGANLDADLYMIFDVDEHGELKNFQYTIKSDALTGKRKLDHSGIPLEERQFVPAYINGKAQPSKLIYKTKMRITTRTETVVTRM